MSSCEPQKALPEPWENTNSLTYSYTPKRAALGQPFFHFNELKNFVCIADVLEEVKILVPVRDKTTFQGDKNTMK